MNQRKNAYDVDGEWVHVGMHCGVEVWQNETTKQWTFVDETEQFDMAFDTELECYEALEMHLEELGLPKEDA